MGRFICIGITHQIRFEDPGSFTPEQFYPLFSRALFDYSLFDDGLLNLRSDIPISDLYNLRKEVIDICEIDNDSSFSPFEYDYFPWHLPLDGKMLNLTFYCLLFWQSPYKFYPEDGESIHEINNRLDSLIHYCLGDNILKDLVKSYISF